MEKIIASCGNDCSVCPRHLPKSDEELRHTAELWMKIGYHDRIVSNDEISCTGCKKENRCRYDVIGCTEEKGITSCGRCGDYPCKVITDCFRVTESFAPSCRRVCTEDEYEIMSRAFFEKEKNLNSEYLKAKK